LPGNVSYFFQLKKFKKSGCFITRIFQQDNGNNEIFFTGGNSRQNDLLPENTATKKYLDFEFT